MQFTFDPIQLLVALAALLLIFGVLPFTPVAVGMLVLGTMTKLTFTL